jgi:8-oxo-dGTP diphosphatase
MSAILFTTRTWQGEPAESIEIIPEWFLLDSLPLERMWADAEHWLPLALTKGEVNVVVTLNPDNETVQSAVTISGFL